MKPSNQQSALSLQALREANVKRQREWDPGNSLTLSFRGNELAGEVGEACNVVKKLERERLGIKGSRATKEQLAEELADVVICTDLIAMDAGVDLGAAVVRKFDASSAKVGLTTRLGPTDDARPLRVYVASKFTNWAAVRTAQEVFRRRGYQITYDWTRHVDEGEPDPTACALADAEGVRSADVLVMLAVPEMRGAYVELGMALALGKPCLALEAGPAQSQSQSQSPAHVFQHLPGYERMGSEDHLLERLKDLASQLGRRVT